MDGKYLHFSTSSELVRVPASGLVYLKADGNYSDAYTADGAKYVLSMQLGQVSELIACSLPEGKSPFIRVGRGLIVNRDYIAYIATTHKRLVLSDSRHFRHELTASQEALKALKDYIEKGGNS